MQILIWIVFFPKKSINTHSRHAEKYFQSRKIKRTEKQTDKNYFMKTKHLDMDCFSFTGIGMRLCEQSYSRVD